MLSPARQFAVVASLSALALLSACGGEEKKATQVAAKVNKDEITVHQVNGALPRLNNPSEDQMKAATKQTLERLIDQQLLIQKAEEAKLDRDPQVMTAIENAKREILARAYLERVMGGADKPSAEAVKEFYDQHPELFTERRIYRMQEVALQIKAEDQGPLREALPGMKTMQDVVNFARTNNIPARAGTQVRAAEQLPMEFVSRIYKMKDGEIVAVPSPNGMVIVQIVQSQSQPLDEKQAQPFIEQFLTNQARMKIAQEEVKKLRDAAKIDYVGDFGKPVEGVAAPAPAPAESKSLVDQAGGQSDDFLEKGLSGLKK
jgi:EpsD family peptidyl-prolyl cis-trans isomerase